MHSCWNPKTYQSQTNSLIVDSWECPIQHVGQCTKGTVFVFCDSQLCRQYLSHNLKDDHWVIEAKSECCPRQCTRVHHASGVFISNRMQLCSHILIWQNGRGKNIDQKKLNMDGSWTCPEEILQRIGVVMNDLQQAQSFSFFASARGKIFLWAPFNVNMAAWWYNQSNPALVKDSQSWIRNSAPELLLVNKTVIKTLNEYQWAALLIRRFCLIAIAKKKPSWNGG